MLWKMLRQLHKLHQRSQMPKAHRSPQSRRLRCRLRMRFL